MRHIEITSFAVRLVGLMLVIHLLRNGFDVGVYSDQPFVGDLSSEPSFRFEGIYLLHASHGFYLATFFLKLLGALVFFAFPNQFARMLWAGIGPGERKEPSL